MHFIHLSAQIAHTMETNKFFFSFCLTTAYQFVQIIIINAIKTNSIIIWRTPIWPWSNCLIFSSSFFLLFIACFCIVSVMWFNCTFNCCCWFFVDVIFLVKSHHSKRVRKKCCSTNLSKFDSKYVQNYLSIKFSLIGYLL